MSKIEINSIHRQELEKIANTYGLRIEISLSDVAPHGIVAFVDDKPAATEPEKAINAIKNALSAQVMDMVKYLESNHFKKMRENDPERAAKILNTVAHTVNAL